MANVNVAEYINTDAHVMVSTVTVSAGILIMNIAVTQCFNN